MGLTGELKYSFIQFKIIFILTQHSFVKKIFQLRRGGGHTAAMQHNAKHRCTQWTQCLSEQYVCLSVWWVTVCRSCVWNWDCCCRLLVTVWRWYSLLLPVPAPWIPAAHSDPGRPEPRPAAVTPPAATHTSKRHTRTNLCYTSWMVWHVSQCILSTLNKESPVVIMLF